MEINGSVAFVTGANRGLGSSYVDALLAAGASKVYAGARNPKSIRNLRACPVKLDVTSPGIVAAAAAACSDVTLLINNAGVMTSAALLAPAVEAGMRLEMEVNVYGVLAMIRAFAPILKRNGGGILVNVLSSVSLVTSPFNATYSASKHAAHAITEAARIQLRGQGTRVVGVYAGFIDTDMTAGIDAPKTSPRQVADRTLEGLRGSQDNVLADERAEYIWNNAHTNRAFLAERMQLAWDLKNT